MRRFIKGKPLLIVTATASLVAGCSPAPAPVDASYVGGNLDAGNPFYDANVPDAGRPDASFVGGNLDVGDPFHDANLFPPDAGADTSVAPDATTDIDAEVTGDAT